MKGCNCIEKLTNKMEQRGFRNFKFKNMLGETGLLLPMCYQLENEKTGELAKKVRSGNYVPLFCPFCGTQLRERDRTEEDV